VWVTSPKSAEKTHSAWCVFIFDGTMCVEVSIVESIFECLDNEALMVFSRSVWDIGQGNESIEEFTIKVCHSLIMVDSFSTPIGCMSSMSNVLPYSLYRLLGDATVIHFESAILIYKGHVITCLGVGIEMFDTFGR
jgi:hypothetical protein